jgi:hypothetical protein
MNPVAVATPPQAHDANGNPVPVTASVNGNTLTLHVPHTTGDWAYPIVVDPLWGWRAYLCVDSVADLVRHPSVKRGAEALVLCWP